MTVHELLKHFERNMRLCVVRKSFATEWWEYLILDGVKNGGIIRNPSDHTETFNALFHANVVDWVYREDGNLGIVIE